MTRSFSPILVSVFLGVSDLQWVKIPIEFTGHRYNSAAATAQSATERGRKRYMGEKRCRMHSVLALQRLALRA